MNHPKKGILLVNLGTPDRAKIKDVRRYLDEFLMDGRVMDLPYLRRALLVRGIIIPFRTANSTKLYQEIWDPQTGSPLMHYSLIQQRLLQEALGDEYHVELAMRYQNPSIADALDNLQHLHLESIQIIPLFPQYASATTGSIIEEAMRIMRKWHVFPTLKIVNDFYADDLMIDAFVENAQPYLTGEYDHVLFSYHGLPVRQLYDVDHTGRHDCSKAGCLDEINRENRLCYVAQSYATTRAIAAQIGLEKKDYTVCFQSRLGKTPWIQPYTSDVLKAQANQGRKKLLVFCPAFVADCLETIHEIGIEYDEEFKEMGGQKVQLVPSLNEHPKWIESLKRMVLGSD